MIWKLSIITLSVAAVATLFIYAGPGNSGAADGPSFLAAALVCTVVFCMMIGPYIAFGLLAFTLRKHRILSLALFAIILVVSISAVIGLYIENEAWLNRENLVRGQRVVPFLIGIAEWASALFCTTIFLSLSFYLKQASGQKRDP